LSSVYVKPKNRIQHIIADVWQQHLGIREIGINDNFFDLGATSLDMMHVNRQLNKVLEKEIQLVTMFEYPTIHSLYRAIGSPDAAGEEDKNKKRTGEIQEGKKMLQQMLRKSKDRR
jgi:acyl carrier protein